VASASDDVSVFVPQRHGTLYLVACFPDKQCVSVFGSRLAAGCHLSSCMTCLGVLCDSLQQVAAACGPAAQVSTFHTEYLYGSAQYTACCYCAGLEF
jgi:hypothetical protein